MTLPTDMIVQHPHPQNPKYFMARIEVPDEEEFHVERRIFVIDTYSKFRGNAANWSLIEPANDFIRKNLDKDEYLYLVKLFIRAKRDLIQMRDQQSAMIAIASIDEKINKTFSKLSIPDRLFDYVVNNKLIEIPDLSEAGTRAQDTPEKTFKEDEYHIINTIIIISKILFPIFGECIDRLQPIKGYSVVKEIMTFGMLNSLLAGYYEPIIRKLQYYFTNIIDQSLPNDPMLAFRGITPSSVIDDRLAKIVIKNFVNYDLYRESGNVMRCLAVTARRAIETETTSASDTKYKPMHDAQDNGSEDGRNVSQLEHMVNIANEPVEVPILVRIAINNFISTYLDRNSVNQKLFEQAISFYKITSIPPTPINELVVAMFIADPIGSAYSVKYMDMEMMVKVITIVQLYALKTGFHSIVPLLSMIPTGRIKSAADMDGVDNYILINEGRSAGGVNYRLNLQESVSHLDDFSNFNFNSIMDELRSFIVSEVHKYNVAPSILVGSDTGKTRDTDGEVKYSENIIAELLHFLYHLLKSDKFRSMADATA